MNYQNVIVREDPRLLQARLDLAKEFAETLRNDWQQSTITRTSSYGSSYAREYTTSPTLCFYMSKGLEAIVAGDQADIGGSVVGKRMKRLFHADHPVWEFVCNRTKYHKYNLTWVPANATNGRCITKRDPNPKFVPYNLRPNGWMM